MSILVLSMFNFTGDIASLPAKLEAAILEGKCLRSWRKFQAELPAWCGYIFVFRGVLGGSSQLVSS